MKLLDFMRSRGVPDDAMAVLVGGITGHGIRKLKYGERLPSVEVASRIEAATGGLVGLRDWKKPNQADGERVKA